MKKTAIAAALILALLTGCVPSAPGEEKPVTVVATTYPVYVFASALTAGLEGVEVERLNTGQVSCLHDYTLSVSDMKRIEQADVIAVNGVELEEFMQDALAASRARTIDCSQGVALLESREHHHEQGHDDHDHGHYDPHIWMSPDNAAQMLDNLAAGLEQALEDQELKSQVQENCRQAQALLADRAGPPEALAGRKLITFHDGFLYFAQYTGADVLKSIEEEAGSEASAREIVEITALVKENRLSAIFTEVNGSSATANAISRETGCAVYPLTMLMSGPDAPAGADAAQILEQLYLQPMEQNYQTIVEAFS